jgi:hypothetical protein
MDCKELENKVYEVESQLSQRCENLNGGFVLAILVAFAALITAIVVCCDHTQRLERLEHLQSIDALGRRVK